VTAADPPDPTAAFNISPSPYRNTATARGSVFHRLHAETVLRDDLGNGVLKLVS
jgi:hypothetical protein